jgi:hypothetical protein
MERVEVDGPRAVSSAGLHLMTPLHLVTLPTASRLFCEYVCLCLTYCIVSIKDRGGELDPTIAPRYWEEQTGEMSLSLVRQASQAIRRAAAIQYYNNKSEMLARIAPMLWTT